MNNIVLAVCVGSMVGNLLCMGFAMIRGDAGRMRGAITGFLTAAVLFGAHLYTLGG